MKEMICSFELYARANNWRVVEWPTSLGALFTVKALLAYSRLSYRVVIGGKCH